MRSLRRSMLLIWRRVRGARVGVMNGFMTSLASGSSTVATVAGCVQKPPTAAETLHSIDGRVVEHGRGSDGSDSDLVDCFITNKEILYRNNRQIIVFTAVDGERPLSRHNTEYIRPEASAVIPSLAVHNDHPLPVAFVCRST